MSNNKQTEIDIAELAMKLYPFSNSERNAFITGYNKAKEMEIHWKTTLVMMENNNKTSIDWFFDQLVLNRIIIINGTTYWDKVKTKYEILLQQAREMYQDEIEAAIIKNCATDSTSEASQYASGYSNGYQRALEMVKWKIDNELRSK